MDVLDVLAEVHRVRQVVLHACIILGVVVVVIDWAVVVARKGLLAEWVAVFSTIISARVLQGIELR